MPNQTYLPLKEAAKKHNVGEEVLLQLIAAGMIEAVEDDGETLVAVDKNGNSNSGKGSQTKGDIIAAKFAHLRGQGMSAYAAQKKYDGIHHNNFLRWARAGYIKILNDGEHRIELDEADVAYCAYIYGQKKKEYGGRLAGVKIFDDDGNPYHLKYKEVAEQMRDERRQQSGL